MKPCVNNVKIRPQERGECDCCYKENIAIQTCPKNNKCEYSLCEDCIRDIKEKTKSDKCPACREKIFELEPIEIIIEESNNATDDDDFEDSLVCSITYCNSCQIKWVKNRGHHCNITCRSYWLEGMYACLSIFCTYYLCSIYQYIIYKFDQSEYIKNRFVRICVAFAYSSIIYTILTIVFRTVWYEINNGQGSFWAPWYLFIVYSIFGLGVCICGLFLLTGVLTCLHNCFCEPNYDDYWA